MVPNFVAIDQTVTEASRFFHMQDVGHPPSWVMKSLKFWLPVNSSHDQLVTCDELTV